MDALDLRLLSLLHADARTPINKLALRLGRSAPATSARLRRLEAAGVIAGFGVRLGHAALGRPVLAFVRLTADAHGAACNDLRDRLASLSEVIELHRVTGDAHFLLKVAVPAVGELDAFVQALSPHGRLEVELILSEEKLDPLPNLPDLKPPVQAPDPR